MFCGLTPGLCQRMLHVLLRRMGILRLLAGVCTCLLGPTGWYLKSPIRGDLHVFTGSFPKVCLRYCSLTGVDRNRGPTAPATVIFSSVQFSYSVLSDALELQHARILCPSLTPRACSNSCPLSQSCHPAISSSVVPLSSYLRSFPVSGSFPMRQFFASFFVVVVKKKKKISISISPSNEYKGVVSFRIDWFDLRAV